MAEPASANASTTSSPPNADAARRSKINAFIVVVLMAQLLLPLRYYLGIAEGDDERFSWRMFSTVRLQRCDVNVSELREGSDAYQAVALRPIVQVAWISILQRFRPSVVEGFLRFRCETEGVSTVRYERRCVTPAGTALAPNRVEIACDSGVISGRFETDNDEAVEGKSTP